MNKALLQLKKLKLKTTLIRYFLSAQLLNNFAGGYVFHSFSSKLQPTILGGYLSAKPRVPKSLFCKHLILVVSTEIRALKQ